MINKQTASFLITPSLLNSWLYIYECVNKVRESESDTICLEDKQSDAMVKAKGDFINTLNRIPSEPNQYMLDGIQFEQDCYDGKTCISPIIEGGAFQIVGKKNVIINGLNILMYGRLDVLKGGVIYDIKRVQKYNIQKYKWSAQHGFYLDLFNRAYKFEYLAYDGNRLHREIYYKDEYKPTQEVISEFLNWLNNNNLLEIYKEKWTTK